MCGLTLKPPFSFVSGAASFFVFIPWTVTINCSELMLLNHICFEHSSVLKMKEKRQPPITTKKKQRTQPGKHERSNLIPKCVIDQSCCLTCVSPVFLCSGRQLMVGIEKKPLRIQSLCTNTVEKWRLFPTGGKL